MTNKEIIEELLEQIRDENRAWHESWSFENVVIDINFWKWTKIGFIILAILTIISIILTITKPF